jgi:hypothetical protein
VSRYLVDKFLYRVDRDPSWVELYMSDPARCVAEWERAEANMIGTERTTAHSFTAEERAALVARDYVTLYAMGAHPFVLWTLFIPILEGSYPSPKAMQDAYAKKISPFGRPDFRT